MFLDDLLVFHFVQVYRCMINCISVEADFRMQIQLKHASQCGFTKIILASAETDMILSLFY